MWYLNTTRIVHLSRILILGFLFISGCSLVLSDPLDYPNMDDDMGMSSSLNETESFLIAEEEESSRFDEELEFCKSGDQEDQENSTTQNELESADQFVSDSYKKCRPDSQ